MVETNPRSLFGKVPYIREQYAILRVTDDVMSGIADVCPECIELISPAVIGSRFIEPEVRIKRGIGFLTRAKQRLIDIGV